MGNDMQKTEYEYVKEDKEIEIMQRVEYFSGDSREKLIEKMNSRLFQLEEKGEILIEQRFLTLSDRIAIERDKKARKKLKRLGELV